MRLNTESEEVLPPVAANFVEQALAIAKRSGIRSPSSPKEPTRETVKEPTVVQKTSEATVCINTNNACAENQNTEQSSISYFKDAAGNEYRMKDGSLYMKGWKDVNAKVRIVSDKTGKEVPILGKKIQVFGWILIQSTKKDDISDVEEICDGCDE